MPPTYVPGLTQPVSVTEYATLTGVREGEVLAAIRSLKLRSAYSNGEWWIEAPQNSEARLAQLRSDKPATKKEGSLVDWVRGLAAEHAQSDLQPHGERDHSISQSKTVRAPVPQRLSELPRRDTISDPKPTPPHQPAVPKPPALPMAAHPSAAQQQAESELARLRARVKTEIPPYESLTDSEKKALLASTYAQLPQPVDYGLTYHETFDALWVGGDKRFRDETPEGGFGNFSYKQGDSVSFYSWWAVLIWFPLYLLGFAIFVALNPNLPGGGWTLNNPRAVQLFFLLMALPGFFPGFLAICAIVQARVEAYKRKHPSTGLLAFRQALCLHKLYAAAKGEADAAAHEAELRKRSYWEFLDGYAFERATAEVLNKHQFDARVTPGSADGGIDIEVTRNGRKGVVQCKAHIASIGPHVVRDLYGVIHHSGAAFGIIVSRGGFTRGAVEFARDKPILFLDTDDLIAMQEGRDVLAAAFSGSSAS